MYVDKQLELSDAQAVTGDAASSNYIDLQSSGSWAENDARLVVKVNTSFDSAGDGGTLTLKVQTDDDSEFGTATDIYTSAAIAQSALTKGAVLLAVRLSDLGTLKRYLRVYYDNGTEAFTAGKVDAFMTWDIEHPF